MLFNSLTNLDPFKSKNNTRKMKILNQKLLLTRKNLDIFIYFLLGKNVNKKLWYLTKQGKDTSPDAMGGARCM
jgi:hypothetical protein